MEEKIREKVVELLNGTKKKMTRKDIMNALGITGSAEQIALGKELDAMEAEALIFREKDNTYQTRDQKGLVSGVIHINKKGVGYIDREGEGPVVIYADRCGNAMDKDTVLVKLDRFKPLSSLDEDYGKVIHIIKHAKTNIIGTYEQTGRGYRFVPDDEKLIGRRFVFHTPQNFHPVDGLKVEYRITSYEEPVELEFVQTIGHKDDPGVDILSILLDYDIEPTFPEDVLKQAQDMPQTVSEEELQGRVDLRNEPTVTIDGDDSKDFDDAVSVKEYEGGWILKVSIADVAHYVKEGSPLDKEAYKRGCSTYVTDRVVPMLPHLLSNGICSLNPHSVRLTNTCEMKVEKDGTVTNYKVYSSVIQSFERMTYHNVNLILDKDKEMCERYAHMGDFFYVLRDCADAIRARRVRNGAVDFSTTESVIVCDEKGHPIDIHPAQRGHAEMMIEDCMIAANVCVADYMNKKQLPCVYRIHEDPQGKRIREYRQFAYLLGHPFYTEGNPTPKDVQQYLKSIEDTEEYPVLSMQMLRCMQKARYDSACVGHFGLGEHEYLHFTSPIRRYPDLIVHRMLERYAYTGNTEGMEADRSKMDDYAEQSSVRERASADAEFACDDMKKAEYMEDKAGMEAEGLITGVTSYGFYVQLDNTVEGLVAIRSLTDDFYVFDEQRMCLRGSHTHKMYQIGQKVRIKVLGAAKDAGTVDFGVSTAGRQRPADRKYNTRSRSAKRSGERARGNNRSYDRGGYRDRKQSRGRRNSNGRKKW